MDKTEKKQTNEISLTDLKKKKIKDIKNIFLYKPFADNNVLAVEATEKVLIMLLSNGTVLSWGLKDISSENCLGRQDNSDTYIPRPLKFSTHIVDIACGSKHCLARGTNFKVYSWGCNSHGQLGRLLEIIGNQNNFPTEIDAFENIKIKQIFASGNTSFGITESTNRIYGWGNNEQNQLGMITDFKYVTTPRLLEFLDMTNGKDTLIYQSKKGDKTFIAEVQRPSPDLNKTLDVTAAHKMSFYHLKDELEELHQEELILTRRLFSLSNKNDLETLLIEDINTLISKYKEKINTLSLNINSIDTFRTDDMIKGIDSQIEFHSRKEHELKDIMKNIENEGFDKDFNKYREEIDEKFVITEKKMTTYETKEKLDKISMLIERVTSELNNQKYSKLNEHNRNQEDVKNIDGKMKRYFDLVEVFEWVKSETNKKIERKNEKTSKKDVESTMKKIELEQKNLEINTQKNIENILPDNDSLIESLHKSTDNLRDLEKKIFILTSDSVSKSKIGQHILQDFGSNISLSKQNNCLTEKIVEFSKFFYNFSLDKLIKPENPGNFNEIKTKIDRYKTKIRKENEFTDAEEDESDPTEGISGPIK